VSEFNLPLLRKAVEWAESEARKPEVESEWFQGYFVMPGVVLDRECETAYCIAGFVSKSAGREANETDDWDDIAMDLLGITYEDAWVGESGAGLFSAGNTIEDVRRIAENIAREYGEKL
jgi:hypothetical protein